MPGPPIFNGKSVLIYLDWDPSPLNYKGNCKAGKHLDKSLKGISTYFIPLDVSCVVKLCVLAPKNPVVYVTSVTLLSLWAFPIPSLLLSRLGLVSPRKIKVISALEVSSDMFYIWILWIIDRLQFVSIGARAL